MKSEDEEVPLAPLNELIWKFRRRLGALTLLLAFSIPAAIASTFIFIAFVANLGFTSSSGIVFAFLLLSAVASLIATVVIPDSLSAILDKIETVARMVAFTITQPRGESPQERLLNQLVNTDLRIRRLLRDKHVLTRLNVELTGESGRKYTFDVYIHKRRNILLRKLGYVDVNVIVKRFDQPEALTEVEVKELKAQVQDVLKSKRGFPTRVILVSASGFEDPVFEHLRTQEDTFSKRFPNLQTRIELVKENLDGTYDVLSF